MINAYTRSMFRIPHPQFPSPQEKIKTGIALSAGTLIRAGKSPDEAFGELFEEVQRKNLLGDGKTFADLVPRKRAKAIKQEYLLAKQDPNFDLREFVNRHFYEFAPHKDRDPYVPSDDATVEEHIAQLWSELERRNRVNRGSLQALPYPYIVPGGRFGEQFYWDSYFIMLGLAADGEWGRINDMMRNYQFMIRKYGFIPTANRSYFLSRSQPPMFSLMVKLLADHRGMTRTYLEYLPYLLAEYHFWMRGHDKVAKRKYRSVRRVAQMDNGMFLNRYYDNKDTPRPESMREDVETAEESRESRRPDRLYLHLRAAAESGWDFSSRWFNDPHDIRTIHTSDIIPVDLNCLLYELESGIAQSYRLMKNSLLAKKFENLARRRTSAINQYCWSDNEKTYGDYNFHKQTMTNSVTLAMVFPLFVGIADQQRADMVARRIRQDFLKTGGLVTTLVENGQQWDAPNGWAPLHWVAIQGLRRYGHDELADEIKHRWIKTNTMVFDKHRKLVEKYDVMSSGDLGGGGEYPLQDGFGWTNGVLRALLQEKPNT